jgi:hypothetical protein
MNAPSQTIVSSLNPAVVNTEARSWIYTGMSAGSARLRVVAEPRLFNDPTAHEDTVQVGRAADDIGPPPTCTKEMHWPVKHFENGRWFWKCEFLAPR